MPDKEVPLPATARFREGPSVVILLVLVLALLQVNTVVIFCTPPSCTPWPAVLEPLKLTEPVPLLFKVTSPPAIYTPEPFAELPLNVTFPAPGRLTVVAIL